MKTDQRIAPHHVDAEMKLLGSILINNAFLYRVSEFLRPEHFYEPAHCKIFRAILDVINNGISANIDSVKSMLENDRQFQGVGGADYLSTLTTLAICIINPEDYGYIVYDLALKRALINIGESIVNFTYDSNISAGANEQIERAESMLFDLSLSHGNFEKNFSHIEYSLHEALDSIAYAYKRDSNETIGIPTGFIDLDRELSGFHDSDLIILAGRPGTGKTALLTNFAINAAQYLRDTSKSSGSIGIFSLEMSAEQLAIRVLAAYTKINAFYLRAGKIDETHYLTLLDKSEEIRKMPIFIDDSPALSLSAIRARARRLKKQHNMSILFIDYLQLIQSDVPNRVQAISEITQGLKALAKELDIPIVVLSQLSRAVEARIDKRPMLSDLRDSGSIEQDADIVLLIYREEYYLRHKQPPIGTEQYDKWMQEMEEARGVTEISIAKHRHGPVNTIILHYNSNCVLFENRVTNV